MQSTVCAVRPPHGSQYSYTLRVTLLNTSQDTGKYVLPALVRAAEVSLKGLLHPEVWDKVVTGFPHIRMRSGYTEGSFLPIATLYCLMKQMIGYTS